VGKGKSEEGSGCLLYYPEEPGFPECDIFGYRFVGSDVWSPAIPQIVENRMIEVVSDFSITSNRRERGNLIILRDLHEIATFAALFATESEATSTRE
jgi:hypothetical protein